jgi:hypothetical protein
MLHSGRLDRLFRSETGSQGLIDKDIAFSSEMSHEYWTDEDLGGAVYLLHREV